MKRIFTLQFVLFLCIGFITVNSAKGQSYCSPSMFCSTGPFGYNINNVTVGGINNTVSTCTHNFTATAGDTIQLTAGTGTTMSVTISQFMGATVFMDLNSNFSFADTGECLAQNNYVFASNYTYTFTITVPSVTPTGYYRLRVISAAFSNVSPLGSCTSSTGSYQDYTVYVTGTGCDPVIVTQPLSATRCIGGMDTFTVAAFGSNLSYQWSLNGTAISGATSPMYYNNNLVTASGGTYTCYIANSACSGPGTTSNGAVLTMNPRPIISVSGPLTFCPGASVVLTSNASNNNQWQLNGTNIYNATNQSYTASAPGIYSVVYTNGCPTTSLNDTVSNYPAPNPVISPSGTAGVVKICTGSTQIFTTTTGTGWSYQWQKNGSSITGANGISYNAVTPGVYTMTNTNSFGCTTTSAAVQLVINTPSSTSISTIGSRILCAGGFKTLYAASSDPSATFQWQFNGNNIAGATSSTYNAYNAGNYTVVSFNGCYVTSQSFILTSLTFPALAASGPTSFCMGGSVKLTSSITDTGGVHYQWMRSGNNIASANSTSYTATDSGVYQLLLIIDSSCTAMSTPQQVNVFPIPKPLVITTGNGYVLNTTQVFTTYQWYWGTTPSSMAQLQGKTAYSLNADISGYYSVAVTDFNNCTGMSDPLKITIISTGLGNLTNNNNAIRIYPNPANSVVHISSQETVNVSICGLDGRLVLGQNDASDIDISKLASGMYIVRVNDNNGNLLKVDKLVKE